MENPVRFDLWAVVRPGVAAEAVAELRRLDPHLAEVEVRRRVSRSWREWTFIPLAGRVRWSQVLAVRAAPPAWAGQLRCYQEGYSPDEPPIGYCPEHDLHFGGCLGCHVCTGFFVR
ncbi:MAG: hypothetical protein JWO38_4406 [Gemmataceae bacterium]|nr:hypothetical protein [Gemmataceae bacterium]